MDLRERIVAAVDAGQWRRAVARLFGLGPATVVRWADRQRTRGTVAARPVGGARRAMLPASAETLGTLLLEAAPGLSPGALSRKRWATGAMRRQAGPASPQFAAVGRRSLKDALRLVLQPRRPGSVRVTNLRRIAVGWPMLAADRSHLP